MARSQQMAVVMAMWRQGWSPAVGATPPSIHGPHRQQRDVTMLSTIPTTPPPQPTSEPPAFDLPDQRFSSVLPSPAAPAATVNILEMQFIPGTPPRTCRIRNSGMGPAFLVLRSSLGESDEAQTLGFPSEPSSELSWAPLGPILYFYTSACALGHFSCV